MYNSIEYIVHQKPKVYNNYIAGWWEEFSLWNNTEVKSQFYERVFSATAWQSSSSLNNTRWDDKDKGFILSASADIDVADNDDAEGANVQISDNSFNLVSVGLSGCLGAWGVGGWMNIPTPWFLL